MASSSQTIKKNGNNQSGNQSNNQNRRPLNENKTNIHDSIKHRTFENNNLGKSIDKPKCGLDDRTGS